MRLNLAKNTFIWLNKFHVLAVHSWCNHGALVCKRSYRYTCAAHFWKKGKQCTDITIQIHSCTLLPAWNVFMSIHFSTHFWKKVKHCNDDTSWVHSCSLLQRVNVSMGDFHFRVNSQHDYGICAPGWQHDCTKMSQRVHRKCTTRSFESGRIFALTRLFLALTRLFFSAKSLKIGGHARHIILNLSCRSRSNS